MNNQVPYLYTVTSGQTLTITNAKSISVLASGGSATVVNSTSQVMSIPDGTTLEMTADTGNTLTPLVITATSAAYVVMLGGIGNIV